ncbi:MAG: sugar phosphate isomerase/epimerase [Acidimicrobiia bacterium]|nr:sugar phosphate isomerase/epimerase [Acidimicrobiia bacterium]MYF84055.1 sugar phosphate isomerase/epimerase [Acidimicrobiia bacterium]
MRVGIDTYSYHRFFGEIREGEEDPGTRWTTWDFLDRAAELRVAGVSLETCYLDLDDPVFRDRLALALDEAGLEAVLAWGHPGGLEMGKSAERLDDLLRVIDHATAMGVHLVRLVVGTFTHWGKEPPHVSLGRLVPRVTAACRHAAEQGIRLAIETHTALPVEALADLVRRVEAPNLGVVLDTANVVRVGSDLVEATRLLAPLTDMVHMKDLDLSEAGFGDPGGWWPCTSLGAGDLDLQGVLAGLRSVEFDGLMCVELATLPPGSDEDRMVAESVAWIREAIRLA